MIQSMTGFGSASGAVGRGTLTVDVRTVNHRFFSPSLKLPTRLQRWEAEVRELLRQRVSRGHVTLTARWEADAVAGSRIDEARAAAYVAQLRPLADRLGIDGGVDLATVLRLPDVLRPVDEEDSSLPDSAGSELLTVVGLAAQALTEMRVAEGERLATELRSRLGAMERALARIAVRAPDRLIEQRDRLRASVRELTEGIALDEQRLAQEIALLADRLDVQEEIARFTAHLEAFRGILDESGTDPVGKRLGFLLQEMLRETNTTGSKANDVSIVRDVLLLKEELERIREQVENLE